LAEQTGHFDAQTNFNGIKHLSRGAQFSRGHIAGFLFEITATATLKSDGDARVCFKEAGLGTNPASASPIE